MNDSILILDTSGVFLSVGLTQKGNLLAHHRESEAMSHAKCINIAIQKVLKIAKLELKNLSAIAINGGPGSFTGLRVASSTAKGLCYALEIPLIALDGPKSWSKQLSKEFPNQNIAVMLNARRGFFYTSFYNQLSNESTSSVHFSFSQIEEKLAEMGGGIMIRSDFPEFQNYLDAKYLTDAVFEKIENKDFEDLNYFSPNYIINNYQTPNT